MYGPWNRPNRCVVALAIMAAWCSISPARGQLLHDLVERSIPVHVASSPVTAGKADRLIIGGARSEIPFSGIAVEAWTASKVTRAFIRFRTDEGWGEPRPMHVVGSATEGSFVAGFRAEDLLPNLGFEIWIEVDPGAGVRFGGAGTFDHRDDQDRRPVTVSGLLPVEGALTGSIVPPPLIPRSEWGARPFVGSPSPLANPSLDYMTFHHAAGYSAFTREDGVRQLRAIQDLHQNVRGWSDIGYHFVIDKGGNLYQGRPFLTDATSLDELPVLALGAHAGNANTGNIGICLLGCYHPPEGTTCTDLISPEAYDTYVTLFAFLSERYGVPSDRIMGHRDFGETSCPGDNNYSLLPVLRSHVDELLVTGNEAIGEVAMEADLDENGVANLSFALISDRGILGFQLERWIGNDRTVLFDVTGPLPAHWADGLLTTSETVHYRLYGKAASGRRQLLDSVSVDADTPPEYALADVFPNPTSDRISVRYRLRDQGRVRLAVYDVLGREVAVLADGFVPGESWTIATWSAAATAAGVYRYRLTVEGFSGVVYDRTKSFIVAR